MDDIAIATHTNDADHMAAVSDVLQLAADHDLYFKLEKCTFHAPRIDYLGVILEKGVTTWTPSKFQRSRIGLHQTKLRTSVHFWVFAISTVLLSEDLPLSPNCSTHLQEKVSNGPGHQTINE